MLPDHAGGSFEGISEGIRAFSRQVAEPASPLYSAGGFSVLLNTAGWTADKSAGDTAAFDLGGFGFSGGAELATGFGSVGLTGTWLWNSYNQGNDSNVVQSDTYELAAYWRGTWDGFSAFARGSAGRADFNGRRTFVGVNGTKQVEKSSLAKRSGTLVSASGGLSYEGGGDAFFFRPTASFDYLKLSEKGYTDKGGGTGLDLIVDPRKSDEFAVNGGVAVGVDFTGRHRRDENWFRIETEGGWREIVGGAMGATTAHFAGGSSFTLEPEEQKSGWYARVRALGGTEGFTMAGEAGAEQRLGGTALSIRGSLKMGF
jgi:hypothetical protein